jgi:hypothetical protein
MLISTRWIVFRRPFSGCIAPPRDTAREHSVTALGATGRQDAQNRCQLQMNTANKAHIAKACSEQFYADTTGRRDLRKE